MGVKNGIYIEADDIATKKIDELFNECDKNNKIPLCPIHPNEPKNTKSIMNKLNVKKKTMHYVHGHIVFTYNNIDFIREWYETCIKLGNIKLAWDETILNVLLWKYECSKIIEYIYDPYYKYIFDIDILKKKYGTKINLNKVYMCHGCKNYKEANNILNLLINDKLKI